MHIYIYIERERERRVAVPCGKAGLQLMTFFINLIIIIISSSSSSSSGSSSSSPPVLRCSNSIFQQHSSEFWLNSEICLNSGEHIMI